jgi:hypothetical protein
MTRRRRNHDDQRRRPARTGARLRRPRAPRCVLGVGPRLRQPRDRGSYVALFPNGTPGPKLLLQRVTEAKTVKNFDIEVADIQTEADWLVALGATRVSETPCSEHGSTWVLMSDPEGNEFCVCDGGQNSPTQ